MSRPKGNAQDRARKAFMDYCDVLHDSAMLRSISILETTEVVDSGITDVHIRYTKSGATPEVLKSYLAEVKS